MPWAARLAIAKLQVSAPFCAVMFQIAPRCDSCHTGALRGLRRRQVSSCHAQRLGHEIRCGYGQALGQRSDQQNIHQPLLRLSTRTPQLLEHLHAGGIGQEEVQQHQVRTMPADCGERFAGSMGTGHRFETTHGIHQLTVILRHADVVIDDQHPDRISFDSRAMFGDGLRATGLGRLALAERTTVVIPIPKGGGLEGRMDRKLP